MRFFKSLKSKLIITTIVVVLFNFLFTQPVSGKSFLAQAGGKLLEPVCELLVFARRLCNRYVANYFFNRAKSYYKS